MDEVKKKGKREAGESERGSQIAEVMYGRLLRKDPTPQYVSAMFPFGLSVHAGLGSGSFSNSINVGIRSCESMEQCSCLSRRSTRGRFSMAPGFSDEDKGLLS